MKKRYYNLLALPALTVIVFCLLSGYSDQDPKDAARTLIDQRMKVLQSAAQSEIPRGEAERLLREIEDDALLSRDLTELRNSGRVAPDKLYSVKFKDMTKKKSFFQYTTYQADIVWDMGQSTQQAVYNVVLKEDNGHFRLTVLEPIKV